MQRAHRASNQHHPPPQNARTPAAGAVAHRYARSTAPIEHSHLATERPELATAMLLRQLAEKARTLVALLDEQPPRLTAIEIKCEEIGGRGRQLRRLAAAQRRAALQAESE